MFVIKLFLFVTLLSANFRLNVHYQSIISRKYPIQNPCYDSVLSSRKYLKKYLSIQNSQSI